jgi:hypothetical protein
MDISNCFTKPENITNCISNWAGEIPNNPLFWVFIILVVVAIALLLVKLLGGFRKEF